MALHSGTLAMERRPLSITILGWLYIAIGIGGAISHARSFGQDHGLRQEFLWAEILSLLAVAAGIYLLRLQNWARILAMVWIAAHIVISMFNPWPELAMHILLGVVFGYLLFRPAANGYFARTR